MPRVFSQTTVVSLAMVGVPAVGAPSSPTKVGRGRPASVSGAGNGGINVHAATPRIPTARTTIAARLVMAQSSLCSTDRHDVTLPVKSRAWHYPIGAAG